MKKCKKCLLLDAGEKAAYADVQEYIESLDSSLLADKKTYLKRLEKCKCCDSLISGTCLKCGCYVEIRARLRDKDCPDVNDKRW